MFNSLFGFSNGCENGLRGAPGTPGGAGGPNGAAAAAAAAAFGLPAHMPLFYWPYPSPSISPNGFYGGMHQQQHMVSPFKVPKYKAQ